MTFAHHVRCLVAVGSISACGPGARTQEAATPREGAAPKGAAEPAPAKTAEPAPAAKGDCNDEPGMIYIPGGDTVYFLDQKTYTLSPFWIDRTEVTVAAFRKFVEAGHSPPWTPKLDRQAYLQCTWGMQDADDLPINCIDWHQAEAYCLWAGKRLPTAQEWGWAARGREEQRKYPWGEETPTCERAVIDEGQTRKDGRAGCGRNRPWPVGSKPADRTRDGALDMFGNVAEPTSSGTRDDASSPRIVQGSSFATGTFARLRVDEHGGDAVREAWSDNGGVRCAKDVGPKPPCTGSGPRGG